MHDVTLDAHNAQQVAQLRQRVFAQYAKFPDMGDKAVLDKLNEDIDWCIRSLAEGRIEAYLVPNREIVLHFLSFEWEMKYERQEIKDGKVVTRYPSYHLDDSMRDYNIHRWLCDWVRMLGTLAKSIALDDEGVKRKSDEGVNEGVTILLDVIRTNPGRRANELYRAVKV